MSRIRIVSVGSTDLPQLSGFHSARRTSLDTKRSSVFRALASQPSEGSLEERSKTGCFPEGAYLQTASTRHDEELPVIWRAF